MIDRIKKRLKRKEIEANVKMEEARALEGYDSEDEDSHYNQPSSESSDQPIFDLAFQEGNRMEHIHLANESLGRNETYQAINHAFVAFEGMLRITDPLGRSRVNVNVLIKDFKNVISYRNLGMKKHEFDAMIGVAHECRKITNVIKHGEDINGVRQIGIPAARKLYPMSQARASEIIGILSSVLEKIYSWRDSSNGTVQKEVFVVEHCLVVCQHCGRKNDYGQTECAYCRGPL